MFGIMEAVGYCMSYAHACVNPIIYTFAAPGFRKTIGKVCKRQNLRKKLRFPQFGSHRLSKITLVSSRKTSHETTRMITLTNHDPVCNAKCTTLLNDDKTPNGNTTML